ncbi:MAG: 3-hydroxyacyl-CoA dehydrogenase NAD-binding domain-containing protein [Sphingobium sp.]
MPVNEKIVSGVAILEIDSPPVNALSAEIRAGLAAGLKRACENDAIEGIVLTGARLFSAGADISEFGTDRIASPPVIWDLFDLFEASAKPVVAAVEGLVMGGGLEGILAADARIASPSTSFSLPEVKLGFIPGAGGSQRLTRLIGPEAAIDLMVKGNSIDAQKALALGIVDAIADDHLAAAVARAKELAASGERPTPNSCRADKVAGFGPDFFAAQRKKIAARTRGQVAPEAVIDAVEAAATLSPEEGMRFERALIQKLQNHPQHHALTYAFRAEKTVAKIPGITAQPRAIDRAAVIGAGTMGAGIAMCFANAGIDVVLTEVNEAALQRGIDNIGKTYDRAVARGIMTPAVADAARARIGSGVGLESIPPVDLVIEAIPEDMAMKKSLFATLDRLMPPETILGTNTSSLDIDEIASATSRPGKVVGTHFFAPANIMKLLENVRGGQTDQETIATVMALGKRLGKISVLAGNCDGFIGNRMLQYYTGSAEFMVERGIAPERIDAVAEEFGMPMGPIALRDLSGLDVAVLIRKERRAKLPEGARMSWVVEALHDAGRLGMKNGKGFYRHEDGKRLPDPEAAAIIDALAEREGYERWDLTDDQIRDRLFLPLANEGMKEIADGTAIRESDIDVAWVNGYGFPKHKGGPIYWARETGLGRVKAMAEELSAAFGPLWVPAPNLDG